MQAQQELDQFSADMAYFDAHRDELLARFPERWVAVYRNRVVGTAKQLPQLMAQLDRKRMPRGSVFVDYVTAKDDLLIL
jgi:hypothetical protein